MLEVYLIVAVLGGVPKVEVYQDMNDACVSFQASQQIAGAPHIYKETLDKHNVPSVTEGDCRPLQKFLPVSGK